MSFSIRLSEEERNLAESYARMHSMSVGDAFKKAFLSALRMSTMWRFIGRRMMSMYAAARRVGRLRRFLRSQMCDVSRGDDAEI